MRSLLPAFAFLLLSQTFASAQGIKAYEKHSLFYNPQSGPYAEVMIAVESRSLTPVVKGNSQQRGAAITIMIRNGDTVFTYDRFILWSPTEAPNSDTAYLIHTQRRLALEDGAWILDVELEDLGDSSRKINLVPASLLCSFRTGRTHVSDISLLQSARPSKTAGPFVKNGWRMVPRLFAFYPDSVNSLPFYAEVYLNDSTLWGQDLLLVYSIHQRGSPRVAGDFQMYEKIKGQAVYPVFQTMNIQDLPSGNYELVIEVRNRENNLLFEKRQFFQRSSQHAVAELQNVSLTQIEGTFVEDMPYSLIAGYLEAMKPIASTLEQRAITDLVNTGDSLLTKQYFYNFWLKRNLDDPESAWKQYKKAVDYVDRVFAASNRPGWFTDRGRVYLVYGPPTEVTQSPSEAGALPYEIWQYNIIPNNETNVIFVFMEEDMTSNDYRLIHSTATGELHNSNWKTLIYRNFEMLNTHDLENTETTPKFGNNPAEQLPR